MDASISGRVVLIHDWLTGMRGGEKVLDIFCRRWPDAPLYTVLHRRGSVSAAIEQCWRLPECALVLSTSHCVAKGVAPPPGTPHVCYCLTPMRYAWHMRRSYGWRGLKGWAVDKLLDRLRDWDRRTAAQVTHFVAISRAVQQRIKECYGRDSVVIYPPVDTDYFCPAPAPREDYYLAMSAFAPYKRLDLAIEACNHLKRSLVVIGSGQDEKRLRGLAGPTIRFLGWQDDAVVRDHLRRCRALLFPGEEDFGIVPVEAQACGTPVIAYGRGGALDTVQPLGDADEPTGILFEEQDGACLAEAIERCERKSGAFDPQALRRHALHFAQPRFEREVFGFIDAVLGEGRAQRRAA